MTRCHVIRQPVETSSARRRHKECIDQMRSSLLPGGCCRRCCTRKAAPSRRRIGVETLRLRSAVRRPPVRRLWRRQREGRLQSSSNSPAIRPWLRTSDSISRQFDSPDVCFRRARIQINGGLASAQSSGHRGTSSAVFPGEATVVSRGVRHESTVGSIAQRISEADEWKIRRLFRRSREERATKCGAWQRWCPTATSQAQEV